MNGDVERGKQVYIERERERRGNTHGNSADEPECKVVQCLALVGVGDVDGIPHRTLGN